MTKREAAFQLHKQGVKTAEIGRRLGISQSTAANYIAAVRDKANAAGKASRVCEYSPDCFTCPLPDCRIDPNKAARLNKLATDREREK